MIQAYAHELIEISNYILTNFGIDLRNDKELIEGRLSKVLAAKGFASYSDYLRHIAANPSDDEMNNLIAALTSSHTCFLRTPQHFDFLEKNILPLVGMTEEKKLHIWCAGCSTGEEPYTLAMMLDQYQQKTSTKLDITILATDISVEVLKKATDGVYESNSLWLLPKQWLKVYFHETTNNNYMIAEDIKKMVSFQQFNLNNSEYPFSGLFDIIFCCNVMIYFDYVTTKNVLHHLYAAAKENGYLFVGPSEHLLKYNSPYKMVSSAIYQKCNDTIDVQA